MTQSYRNVRVVHVEGVTIACPRCGVVSPRWCVAGAMHEHDCSMAVELGLPRKEASMKANGLMVPGGKILTAKESKRLAARRKLLQDSKPHPGAVGTLTHGPERRDGAVPDGSFTLEDDEPDAAVADAAERALEALAIPLDDIVRSPHNTRRTFPQASLDELAASMRSVGQTTACEVLPAMGGKYELVDGERRFRAAQLAGRPTLRCVVRDVGHGSAIEIDLVRFEANRHREDLNPIDEALTFERFLTPKAEGGHGLSQAELAKRVGVSPSQISNRVRLLRLPERARGLVISGEMSIEVARELAAFCDLPKVAEAVQKSKIKNWNGHETANVLEQQCTNIDRLAKGVRDKHAEALQPRHFKRNEHWGDWFATGDQDLAKRLLEEHRKAEEARWARNSGGSSKKGKAAKVDPDAAAKRKAEILNKRLWRYVVQWHIDRLPKAVETADIATLWRWTLFLACRSDKAHERLGDLHEAVGDRDRGGEKYLESLFKMDALKVDGMLRRFMAQWVDVDPTRFSESFRPAEIVEMAKQVGVSIETDWRIDDFFIGLFDAAGLADLWVELGFQKETKTSIPSGAKRAFAVAQFVAAIAKSPDKKRPFPKCLRNVQPVSLT